MHWTLFCRVIDNLGDVGVCWRLARGLAARGQRVSLVIDDASALAWMAPTGAAGVRVLPWPSDGKLPACGDVVVEAFGCDLPSAFIAGMAASARPPVWLNLEYLSAERYVERSHGLPSPQANGLMKWFFYPGFTLRTGGLLRECDLLPRAVHARGQVLPIASNRRKARPDPCPFLVDLGCAPLPGERVVSLFCYDNPALPALLQSLSAQPTLLLLTPGPAQQQVQHAPPGVRLAALPWLTQDDYDRLLWGCDLNFVRGEDSLVRALWASRPFVWQIYPQHDGAHVAKLEAFLDTWGAPPDVARLWRAWNGVGALPWPGLPPLHPDWQAACAHGRDRLAEQASLVDQLLAFVVEKASGKARSKAPGGC
jgi:uncharacterized repeat protein (TIGR03837 family)